MKVYYNKKIKDNRKRKGSIREFARQFKKRDSNIEYDRPSIYSEA